MPSHMPSHMPCHDMPSHMPCSPHSLSFPSLSAIICLHTSLAIIASCSVIAHPELAITCPPMSLLTVHSTTESPRFEKQNIQICLNMPPCWDQLLCMQNIKGQISYLTLTQFELLLDPPRSRTSRNSLSVVLNQYLSSHTHYTGPKNRQVSYLRPGL